MKKINYILDKIVKLFKGNKDHILLIEVTDEDIQEGVPISSQKCPIARAIYRKTGKTPSIGLSNIRLDCKNVYTSYMDCSYNIPTTKSIIQFIRHYDTCHSVKPFSFKIDLKKERIV